ncbi:MAG: FKBP-type peptidyl-prolyl cis-trans isomerase [Coriobacteriia bacterium]|nr:FKBP-type peptidyl-prolyl cis-trans isomerase [Coriobacteriia bacterium]
MKKTVLLLGILLGAMLVLTACNGDSNGDGDAVVVEVGDTVVAEYTGKLAADGEVFDSSAERGAPLEFVAGVGMMIPGFDDAVLGMELNEEKTVEIPSDQAYGSAGITDPQTGGYLIPPDSDLIFEIKVIEIIKPDTEEDSE